MTFFQRETKPWLSGRNGMNVSAVILLFFLLDRQYVLVFVTIGLCISSGMPNEIRVTFHLDTRGMCMPFSASCGNKGMRFGLAWLRG